MILKRNMEISKVQKVTKAILKKAAKILRTMRKKIPGLKTKTLLKNYKNKKTPSKSITTPNLKQRILLQMNI